MRNETFRQKINRRGKKYKNSAKRLPAKVKAWSKRLTAIVCPKDTVGRLGYVIRGGMGDYVIAKKFLSDLSEVVFDKKPIIFCCKPQLMEWLRSGLPDEFEILDTGSLTIMRPLLAFEVNINTTLSIRSFPGKYLENAADDRFFRDLANRIQTQLLEIQELIELSPRLDGYIGQFIAKRGFHRHDFLHHLARLPYKGPLQQIDVAKPASKNIPLGPYITISNGFDESFAGQEAGKATKVYERFDEMLAFLKLQAPYVTIVHIGTKNCQSLSKVDMNLTGQTTLPEVAWIIKGAQLHIDNEGGLVHLASALGIKSCVVFGPTSPAYFGYANNINIEPRTCGSCWWLTRSWMQRCPAGHESPPCMQQDPQSIACAAANELNRHEEIHARPERGAHEAISIRSEAASTNH